MRTHATSGRSSSTVRALAVAALLGALCAGSRTTAEEPGAALPEQLYEHQETRDLVSLVNDAGKLIEARGEAAFAELSAPGSRWRQADLYVFVLDTDGNMRVHPDPALEGKPTLDLKDVNGRLIVRGLIHAATAAPGRTAGWYHYEWPVPGGLLPRWKSSYVRLVSAPSGKPFVVGCGVYNDRMERAFVVDMVQAAVGRVEALGERAFPLFRDRTGPFIAKDAYVFVIDPNGVDVVNPAFPNLEGRPLLDVKDTQGKRLIQEMLDVAKTRGAGWVDYMWPKPGESVSTRKSAYVSKANVGTKWLLVGAGVYLADAPKGAPEAAKMTAPALMAFVREAASVFERRGEAAFPEFRVKGSKWFHDDTYVFVWTADGTRVFNAGDPSIEGRQASGIQDARGRPYGRMFLDVAASRSGEGWVHYMFPEPGSIFPSWKSSFLKRVTSPSGKQHLVGAGIYHLRMDKAFIEDVVDRASALVAARGKEAFADLRDPTGPFLFMDTYVFVGTTDGVELVNPAQPSLEGRNLIDLKDARGKTLVREYVAAALKDGSAWVEYHWYKPGQNTVSRKATYVRLVRSGAETYVVGSGLYLDDDVPTGEPVPARE